MWFAFCILVEYTHAGTHSGHGSGETAAAENAKYIRRVRNEAHYALCNMFAAFYLIFEACNTLCVRCVPCRSFIHFGFHSILHHLYVI